MFIASKIGILYDCMLIIMRNNNNIMEKLLSLSIT